MFLPKVDSSQAAGWERCPAGSPTAPKPTLPLDFSQYSGPPGRAFLPLINIIPRAWSGGGEGGDG